MDSLEALDRILKEFLVVAGLTKDGIECFAQIEISLKVLNIISKKNVNVQQIRESKTVSEYNHYVIEHYIGFVVTLTEEEFKLIKENL